MQSTATGSIPAYQYTAGAKGPGTKRKRERRKESVTMEENNRKDMQEDPTPLTDEEFERYQKKEKRKVTIIGDIIDFIVSFFH